MSEEEQASGPETDERIGSVLADRYKIEALIGLGGMGRVYRAEHVLMRKKLAVKILHHELSTVPNVVARFEREALAAAHIEHSNVAAASDFGTLRDGAIFLVLEYVEGRCLRDEIDAGAFPLERALHIVRQIASALEVAHALEIVHRDLKPENVMLVEKGGDPDFVKVLDFGVARVPIGEMTGPSSEGKVITKTGMVFGTPEYMAPEQALGQPVDGRADLYALGIILYELLAGVRPFDGKSQVGILGQQLSAPPPPFAQRVPGLSIPAPVENLVMGLLQKEPDDRYQESQQVLSTIDSMLGGPANRGSRRFSVPGSYQRGSIPSTPSDASPVAPPLSPAGEVVRHQVTRGQWSNKLPPVPAPPPTLKSKPTLAYHEGVQVPEPEPVSADEGETQAPVEAPPSTLLQGQAPPSRSAVRRALDGVFDWVDYRRARLPVPVRDTLRPVPTPVLLFGVVGLALTVVTTFIVVLGFVIFGSSKPPGVPDVSVIHRAPEMEVAKARGEGAAALAELSNRYPKDTGVLMELMGLHLFEKEPEKAVAVAKRALEVDPELKDNKQLHANLWLTVQQASASDAAFELLEGPMEDRGRGMIFDVATADAMLPGAKKRANAWLADSANRPKLSPGLAVAVELHQAKSCNERHALLDKVKEVGDERSASFLKLYKMRVGCGKRGKADCFPCMRRDGKLAEATTAVEKRTQKPKD